MWLFSGGRLVTPRYPIIFVVYKKKQPVRMSTKNGSGMKTNRIEPVLCVCVCGKKSLYTKISDHFLVYTKNKNN